MHLKDVLDVCKESGHPITKQALYVAGIKNGFLSKADGNTRWDFNEEKFNEWLKKATEEIPEGWVTLKEIPEMFNVSIATAYRFVQEEICGAKYFGAGKGVLYVDPKQFEEVIRKRNKEYKEKFNEE